MLNSLYRIIFCICLSVIIPAKVSAQLEKVIVEKYYISDANDATDTTGGYLVEGSTTYRIYIDLDPGYRLTKLYGDTNHVLRFSSTEEFFNNKADGESYGKNFAKNRLGENTVALDTWITLGQTTRNSGKTYFGVLKENDDNGSFIGGINNDGGSAAIASGLLANNDSLAGIPLTIKDGMDTLTDLPATWGDYGIYDLVSQTDTTIFGSLVPGSEFRSINAGIFNSGVMGVIPDSNQVLVAQLTTHGTLSFELNIEILDSAGNTIKYVANDSILKGDEILSRYLKYPYIPVCGCPDPDYLEYLNNRDCDDVNLCQTLVVLGCMDSTACNWNPDANMNVPALCCYPGYCNDRDLSVVCPELSENRSVIINSIYPNPADDLLNIHVESLSGPVYCEIYNIYGRVLTVDHVLNDNVFTVDISALDNGLYIVKIFNELSSVSRAFAKN